MGLGRWARVLARGAQRGDKVELYSCFSRDAAKREAFQRSSASPAAPPAMRSYSPIPRWKAS